MSTVKSSSENLTLNADGVGSDVVIQNNGTETVRINEAFQFNSGYGSVVTAYGVRAWVNFNGIGTVAIRGSGNVSSVTDLGVGNYRPNFTTAMPDTNYAAVGTAGNSSSGILGIVNAANRNISFCQVYPISGGVDAGLVEIAIFR